MRTSPAALRCLSLADGFTLVELLVVVCIIGVLMVLTVPLVGMVRDASRGIQCMNNQRQMHQALVAFAGEHKDRLPSSGDPGWSLHVRLTDGQPSSTSHLIDQGYLSSTTVFTCPQADAQRRLLRDNFSRIMGIDWAYFYAANLGYVGTDRDPSDQVMGRYWWTGARTSRLRTSAATAARTVLLVDRVMFVSYTDTNVIAGQFQLSATAVHQGGKTANAAYVDGRVAALRVNDLHASWVGIDEGCVPSDADFLGSVAAGQ